MELLEVNRDEYLSVVNAPYHMFNSMQFNEANKENADRIHYFLFKDKKHRLGLIAGLIDKTLISPFSAPFGGFSFVKDDIRIKYLESALPILESWALANKITKLQFTLPPLFYHDTFIAKRSTLYLPQIIVLMR